MFISTIYSRSEEIKEIKKICNFYDSTNKFTAQQILDVWLDYSEKMCASWIIPGSLENENENENENEETKFNYNNETFKTYSYIKGKIEEMNF